MSKERVTVTVDAALVAAAKHAVDAGAAPSVSAWVAEAMSEHADRTQRRAQAWAAIAEYEAAFGTITDEVIERQRRTDRDAAAKVRARVLEIVEARDASGWEPGQPLPDEIIAMLHEDWEA